MEEIRPNGGSDERAVFEYTNYRRAEKRYVKPGEEGERVTEKLRKRDQSQYAEHDAENLDENFAI